MNYMTRYYKNLCEDLQRQINNLIIQLSEVAALPPTQFSVEPEPTGPGEGDLNMPVGSGGQWMLNGKHAWNWSPEGGWPDGKKYFDGSKTWIYDRETDSWYVYGKDGRAYERIPHGRPDRYWQGPNFNTQPPENENENEPVRPRINRPGWPEPGVMPGLRNR